MKPTIIVDLPALRSAAQPGSKLLVAVSGGADSMCLLHALSQLQNSLHVELHVVHVNHLARGLESDADEELVRVACQQMRIPLISQKITSTRGQGETREEFFRRERYRIYRETADSIRATCVALAHTADDLAETFLMNLLRGAGLRGMGNFSPLQHAKGMTLIRPLWKSSRPVILRYVRHHKIDYRDDASNADLNFTRNRVRHELLPFLEEKFNPNVRQTLLRTGQSFSELYAFVQLAAQDFLKNHASASKGKVGLDAMEFAKLPGPVMVEVLRQWAATQSAEALDLSAERVRQLKRFLTDNSKASLSAGENFLFVRHGKQIYVEVPQATQTTDATAVSFNTDSLLQGNSALLKTPHGNFSVCACKTSGSLPPVLLLRKRQDGDRLSDRTKLKELLIKDKVPLRDRDTLLLIADADGLVYHVIGNERINARLCKRGAPELIVKLAE